MNNKKILLVSSSIGFRVPSPIGIIKIFKDYKTIILMNYI